MIVRSSSCLVPSPDHPIPEHRIPDHPISDHPISYDPISYDPTPSLASPVRAHPSSASHGTFRGWQVLFLTGMLAMIMTRTLHRDLRR
jgi:hypothetical protein